MKIREMIRGKTSWGPKLAALSALFAILAMLLAPVQALALDPIFTKNATGSSSHVTLGTTANVGAVAMIPGDNNSQVVVTSISMTSDCSSSTSDAFIYDKENEASVNSTSAAGQTEIGISSGGANFDQFDIIVIQNASGSRIFYETVSSVGATTIATVGALDYSVGTGYTVYEMEHIGTIPVDNATVSFNSDVAVVAGATDSPLLIWLGGATACSINFASGHYK